MSSELDYDFQYQRLLRELNGWKILRNGYVHDLDRIDKTIKIIGKDGLMKYDSTRVRIALFGLDLLGTLWIDRLVRSPRIKLVACVEENVERANYFEYVYNLKSVKMIHPNCSDEVFDSRDIDAIILTISSEFSEDLILKSLLSGKAVLFNGPWTDRIDTVSRTYKLSIDRGLLLLTSMVRRYDQSFRLLRKRVRRSDIGSVRIIKVITRDSLPYHPSHHHNNHQYYQQNNQYSIFLDLLVHDVDLICWVLGELPMNIHAISHDMIVTAPGEYESVAVIMKFPSGAIGMIESSRGSNYGFDCRLEVLGTNGMLSSPAARPVSVTLNSEEGASQTGLYTSSVSRFYESYINQLDHFVDCIKGLNDAEVKPREVIAAIKIAHACSSSAHSGKIIELFWKEDWINETKHDEE